MSQPRDHDVPEVPRPSRMRAFDRVGVLLGIAVGLPSLLYPFGSDQAVSHYIASGWLQGAWPYVDSIDYRPPGIHAVYGAAISLLGFGEGSIRLLDLALVVALGLVLPHLLRRGPRWPGESGAAVLLLATSYYTLFDYADTAQAELWEAALLVFCWVLGRASSPTHRRLAGAGAIAGLALMFNYAAAPIVLAIAVLLAARRGSFGRSLSGLVSFALGTTLALCVCLAPFAWYGALPSLWEATGVFSLLYAQVVGRPRPASLFWIDVAGVWVLLTSTLWISGLARATSALRHSEAWAREALRCGLELGWVLTAAWLSVAIQRRFWIHHHVVLLPFAITALLWGLRTTFRARPGRVIVGAFAIAAAGVAIAPSWPSFGGSAPLRYTDHWPIALAHFRGTLGRDAYVARVSRSRSESEARELGLRIAEAAEPGDGLCVFGTEALVYTTSGLRCPSRFFVTGVLSGGAAGFREGAWVEEHGKAIQAAPPEFILAPDAAPFAKLEVSYRPWLSSPSFTVFRRVAPSAAPEQEDRS